MLLLYPCAREGHLPLLTPRVSTAFNSFLAGFMSCVAQFVLTACLRFQADEENRLQITPQVRVNSVRLIFVFWSPFLTRFRQAALGQYVLASLVLHLGVMCLLG